MVKVMAQKVTKRYAVYNQDCVLTMQAMDPASVGLCIHSPPFASLYSYSSNDSDLSNAKSYEEFFTHYGFVAEQLRRVMMPGRIVCIHCMDLPMHKNAGEEIGIQDFPGDIVRLFQKYGFTPHSHHAIWKDPLVAATRTKALGLAHKQIVKDSSMCRMGIADYIWAFRAPGVNPKPIQHPKGLTEYAGERQVPRDLDRFLSHLDPRTNKRSHWIWQQYASPVWDDIRQTNTLNYKAVLSHKAAKDKDDQRHLCPLQKDVIERCLVLWSNPGDVVLTPFAGCGSEVYMAVKLGRKGIGIELKPSYYRQMLRNLKALRHEQETKAGGWSA